MMWRRKKDKIIIEGDLDVDAFLDGVIDAKETLQKIEESTAWLKRAAADANRAANRLNVSTEKAERAEHALRRAQKGR